jgi:hypothetical protein
MTNTQIFFRDVLTCIIPIVVVLIAVFVNNRRISAPLMQLSQPEIARKYVTADCEVNGTSRGAIAVACEGQLELFVYVDLFVTRIYIRRELYRTSYAGATEPEVAGMCIYAGIEQAGEILQLSYFGTPAQDMKTISALEVSPNIAASYGTTTLRFWSEESCDRIVGAIESVTDDNA